MVMQNVRVSINNFPISAPFHSIDSAHHLPHKGIDFAMPTGTPVESIGDGVVKFVMDEGNKSFGKSVWVQMDDGNMAVYGHLSGFNVKVGQHIQNGQIVAYSGSTGDSTGPHLHLGILHGNTPIDPMPYLQGSQEPSFTESIKSIGSFFYDLKHQGLWQALTGESFGVWFGDIVDGAAIAVACIGAMLGLMGWKKGWQVVYWDAGIYILIKSIQYTYGGA